MGKIRCQGHCLCCMSKGILYIPRLWTNIFVCGSEVNLKLRVLLLGCLIKLLLVKTLNGEDQRLQAWINKLGNGVEKMRRWCSVDRADRGDGRRYRARCLEKHGRGSRVSCLARVSRLPLDCISSGLARFFTCFGGVLGVRIFFHFGGLPTCPHHTTSRTFMYTTTVRSQWRHRLSLEIGSAWSA